MMDILGDWEAQHAYDDVYDDVLMMMCCCLCGVNIP